ncbi:MAG TPA: hypothetical protein VG326_02415 [Tepidisphaeraceae bacterium]|jgi:hypothetical protein|nr:hypothetical protein [Tepidisphaeraceae bacterium]
MARSKHAAALFEVMSGPKKGNTSRSQLSMRTPNWWFKTHADPQTAAVIDPNDPTTTPIKSPLIAPRIAAVEEPERASPAARQATPVARPKRDLIDPTRPVAATRNPADGSRALQFDRVRHEVKLRLPLAHAVVGGFAVVVVVGLAYVMGKHQSTAGLELVTTETSPALSTDVPRTALAQPGVLDVNRPKLRPSSGGGSASTGGPHISVAATHVRDHDFTSTLPVANNAQGMHVAPRPASINGPRTIGLNYVVAQCYPSEQVANDARDFLVKNGIPSTVEKGCSWAPKWYSVVTTRGFEHIHTSECETFQSQIERLGDKFAGNGLKRFEPMLVSWK